MLSERLDRVISFDEKTGILTAEAGLTLEQVLHDFVPKGWFLPVSPGTAYVSLGGCLAADVHGKNHHCDGAFGQHVVEFNLAVADGRVIRCSRDEHANSSGHDFVEWDHRHITTMSRV